MTIAYVALFLVNIAGGEPKDVEHWNVQSYPNAMELCLQSAKEISASQRGYIVGPTALGVCVPVYK